MAASKHWLSDHIKENRVKIPLIILLYALILFILFIIIKAFFGYHVKILGFEVNEPRPKTDTVIVTNPTIIHDTVREAPLREKPQSPTNISSNRKQNKKSDTVSVIQGKNVNTGTNQGIIGDNGVMSIDQPVLTESYKKLISERVDKLRNENKTSHVMIFLGSGSNAGQFASALEVFLKSKGFVVGQAMGLEPFSGMEIEMTICADNVTKCIGIYIGNLK